MKFEALPRPQAGDVVWEIEQEGEILEIQVEEENFKQEQHYIVYPLQQVQEQLYSKIIPQMLKMSALFPRSLSMNIQPC